MEDTTTHSAAFEALLDTLDQTLEAIQAYVHTQVDQGAFAAAQKALERAQTVRTLRGDIAAIAERYADTLTAVADIRGSDRLPRGLKTPQDAYRIPILEALVALGGEAEIGQVLERVFAAMKDQLNAYDLSDLPNSDNPRWRNTAQWARNAMREEGQIRDDSPRGIWAISERGRAWLESHTRQT